MKPHLLVLVAVSAAVALTSPVSAQEIQQPVPALMAEKALAPTAAPLELRIEEARQSYQHNRRLGTGLITAGAAVVVGSLVDWAHRDRLGMSIGGAGVMVGGAALVAWGADRHRVAREAVDRAETWETGMRSPESRR